MNKLNHPIQILDSTLREGEQAAGVRFSLAQKLSLARRLDAFGVDFLEVGHPVVSESIRDSVSAVAALGLRAQVLAHARATQGDIQAVYDCGAPWVGIFCGINRYTLECKLKKTRAEAITRISEAIRFAKSLGLYVRYSCEDASRTDIGELIDVYRQAIEAGADRIGVVDTVGALTPRRSYELVARLKTAIPAPIHIHCHNDLGMAVANALSAIEAGAACVDVTVNGIGERSGIPSLAEMCAALKVIYGVPNTWRMKQLNNLSRLAARYAGLKIDRFRPVVGQYAFSHKAGLHSAAVLRNPATYEVLEPTAVGAIREIIIGEMTGRTTIESYLAGNGRDNDTAAAKRALTHLKSENAKQLKKIVGWRPELKESSAR